MAILTQSSYPDVAPATANDVEIVPGTTSTGDHEAASTASKATRAATPLQGWRRVQRERERQQRENRERVRARIKADRAEQKFNDEIRRQHDKATKVKEEDSSHSAPSIVDGTNAAGVRVQVRTFDGSTIRARFEKEARITTDVRPWIDSTSQSKVPYNLKIILTPLPNRNIEAAEEQQSLEDLDIIDSCTMVMLPVRGFVESYSPSDTRLVGNVLSGSYNILRGSIGAVWGGVKTLLGFGGAAAVQHTTSTQPGPSEVRVRTLADQRNEEGTRDQQFYNGNQLNFQPRKEEEEQQG
jgi:hypothetical protein